jgi:hypothetical protein
MSKSKDLYETCTLCDRDHGRETCPGCDGLGFTKTGLTLGQVERMAYREQCVAGDPGVPEEKRRDIVKKLKAKVDAEAKRLGLE